MVEVALVVVPVEVTEPDVVVDVDELTMLEEPVVVTVALMVVEVAVVNTLEVVGAVWEGRKRLTPRPRPKAENIAITAPTAICLLN